MIPNWETTCWNVGIKLQLIKIKCCTVRSGYRFIKLKKTEIPSPTNVEKVQMHCVAVLSSSAFSSARICNCFQCTCLERRAINLDWKPANSHPRSSGVTLGELWCHRDGSEGRDLLSFSPVFSFFPDGNQVSSSLDKNTAISG